MPHYTSGDVSVPGRPPREVWMNRVGPNYFRTMRTRLLEGREFRWTDTDESPRVVILNESAAKLLFPNQSALGQRVGQGEIVGIVADAKYVKVQDAAPATLYSPVTQELNKQQPSLTLLVRTAGPPAPVIAAAGKIVGVISRMSRRPQPSAWNRLSRILLPANA